MEEERKWIQNKLKGDYSFTDLLELGRIKYNNLVENNGWANMEEPETKEKEKPQILALATEILRKLNTEGGASSKPRDASNYNSTEQRTYQEWRFQNPDGLKKKELHGATMRW